MRGLQVWWYDRKDNITPSGRNATVQSKRKRVEDGNQVKCWPRFTLLAHMTACNWQQEENLLDFIYIAMVWLSDQNNGGFR